MTVKLTRDEWQMLSLSVELGADGVTLKRATGSPQKTSAVRSLKKRGLVEVKRVTSPHGWKYRCVVPTRTGYERWVLGRLP